MQSQGVRIRKRFRSSFVWNQGQLLRKKDMLNLKPVLLSRLSSRMVLQLQGYLDKCRTELVTTRLEKGVVCVQNYLGLASIALLLATLSVLNFTPLRQSMLGHLCSCLVYPLSPSSPALFLYSCICSTLSSDTCSRLDNGMKVSTTISQFLV